MTDKINTSLLKLREKFKPEGHSNYLCFEEGETDPYHHSVNRSCYSEFGYGQNSKLEKVFVFFGKETYINEYKPELWCDWIINDSQYADAFITKDAKEGLRIGFELNTHSPRGMMLGGAITLRNLFEFKGWMFGHCLEMGFSGHESYALSVNISNGNLFGEVPHLIKAQGNTNHLVINRWNKFSLYEGKGYNEDEGKGETLSKGYIEFNINLSSRAWGSASGGATMSLASYEGFSMKTRVVESPFGAVKESVALLTKENLMLVLAHLKGKK